MWLTDDEWWVGGVMRIGLLMMSGGVGWVRSDDVWGDEDKKSIN